ncbi:MAG TPA: hypothetical protein VME23_08015 [Terracidiphilus sp.]|nr:hypothetical protein [Terracidiphilus sp.]
MARLRPFILYLLSSIVLPAAAHPQAWSGILAPSRAIDWSGAGVIGGIPAGRIQCGNTIAPYSGSPSVINDAIAACPANHFVQLAAGTFNLSGGIVIDHHNNVTLRGMGADKTFLVFSATGSCTGPPGDICVQSGDGYITTHPPNGFVSWTGGYAKGSTVITLASVPNLVIGNTMVLDQLDDRSDDGAVYVCAFKGPGCSSQGGGGAQRQGRAQYQVVTVTGCNGSTTPGFLCSGTNVAVTIDRGLDMPNWRAEQAPQAWWSSHPASGVGIEDMSLDHTVSHRPPGEGGISFLVATNSWVKGVRDIDSQRTHVEVMYSSHITVRDSYFFLTQSHRFESYGVDCLTSSDLLVENNIFQAVAGPMMMNSCTGSVWAYNYAVNDYYSLGPGWILPMSSAHASGVSMILQEGNIGPEFASDNFHGSHQFVTEFRNFWAGTEPACYQSGTDYATIKWGPCLNPFIATQIDPFSRFYNYVGNVLGTPGLSKSYQNGEHPIYFIKSGNIDQGVTIIEDPNTEATLMRWGNYDTVNAAARFEPNEVPSKLAGILAPFSNPIPASKKIPPSFYLSAKPSWWPARKPWPAIGPDVHGGNVPGYNGHAYTIPAEDCYLNTMKGSSDGADGPLTFNAHMCYKP